MCEEIEKTLQNEQELSAKKAYFDSLAEWTRLALLAEEAMYGFPVYLLVNYPQLFFTQIGDQPPGAVGLIQPNPPRFPERAPAEALRGRRRFVPRHGPLNGHEQLAMIEHHGGYEFFLAPLWKRTAAQVIDMVLLFMLKIILVYGLIRKFTNVDEELLWLVLEDDLMIYFFGMVPSTKALFARLVLKLVGFCYEPLWTGCCNGATPGKWLMGIQIRPARAVVLLRGIADAVPGEPPRVLLYPPRRISMRRAISRAVTKNLVTSIILPISITFVFRRVRTQYDKWSNTIVVVANSNPWYHPGIGNTIRNLR